MRSVDSGTREETARQVRLSVVRAGLPSGAIYGSWAHDDFHLDETRRQTFSDLDLLIPPGPYGEADNLKELTSLLASVIPMRVTVRNHDDLDCGIDSTSDRWITLTAFASSFLLNFPGSAQMFRNYAEAKTLLMLLRHDRSERYAQIAEYLDMDAAHNALEIKLGLSSQWKQGDYRSLLVDAVAEPFRSVFALIVQENSVNHDALGRLADGLAAISDRIPVTLFEHTRSKLVRIGDAI